MDPLRNQASVDRSPWDKDGDTRVPLVGVVDDDASFLRALGRLLRAAGFRVETFASAEQFLESRPAGLVCLILDVRLGGMSGFELHDLLVVSGSAPPVIFITAHDDVQTRERARRAGAVRYLRKPFDEAALIDALDRVSGTTRGPTVP